MGIITVMVTEKQTKKWAATDEFDASFLSVLCIIPSYCTLTTLHYEGVSWVIPGFAAVDGHTHRACQNVKNL